MLYSFSRFAFILFLLFPYMAKAIWPSADDEPVSHSSYSLSAGAASAAGNVMRPEEARECLISAHNCHKAENHQMARQLYQRIIESPHGDIRAESKARLYLAFMDLKSQGVPVANYNRARQCFLHIASGLLAPPADRAEARLGLAIMDLKGQGIPGPNLFAADENLRSVFLDTSALERTRRYAKRLLDTLEVAVSAGSSSAGYLGSPDSEPEGPIDYLEEEEISSVREAFAPSIPISIDEELRQAVLSQLAQHYRLVLDGAKFNLIDAIAEYRRAFPDDATASNVLLAKLRAHSMF